VLHAFPSYTAWFNPNNVGRGVQIADLLFPSFCHFHLYTDILLSILTYSMVQSPSWAANGFAASQEIPRISRNPMVHYRTHKRPPPVSILGPPNPVYIPTSHILEIHPIIIHPSTPRSPQWSLSLRFPNTLYVFLSLPRAFCRLFNYTHQHMHKTLLHVSITRSSSGSIYCSFLKL